MTTCGWGRVTVGLAFGLVIGGLLGTAGRAQEPVAPLYPIDVAVAGDGTMFVVDRDLPGVWSVKDGAASILVRGSKRIREPLNAPRCIAIGPAGEILVGDSAARNVFVVSADAPPRALSASSIGIPMGMTVAPDGRAVVADLETHRILALPIGDAPAEPELLAEIRGPKDVAYDPAGALWVLASRGAMLRRVEADGSVTDAFTGEGVRFAAALSFDGQGTPVLSDSYAPALLRIVDGTPQPLAQGDAVGYPVGVARTEGGWVVADSRGGRLVRIADDGQITPVPLPAN